jgi:hypothetical protein
MRTIEKPKWLIYATKVVVELNNLHDNKSGKRQERHEMTAWKKASSELGYEGTLRDWQFLIRKLGRQKVKRTGDFL